MKRFVVLVLSLALPVGLGAQALVRYDSEHYRVTTDVSNSFAGEIANRMEAAYDMFGDVFHLEPSARLRVTVFAAKHSFDAYLAGIIDETRQDFVYIHYADAEKSELVGFVTDSADAFNASLLHQGCIQFLKASVPHPPVWLREGTATYLEKSTFSDREGRYVFKPNLAWLPALKAMLAGQSAQRPLGLTQFLMMDNDGARTAVDSFYPQAWAAVAFLLEADDPKVNRIFWDSISALNPSADLMQNSGRVAARVAAWYDPDRLGRQFSAFVDGMKTFNELVAEGTRLYAEKLHERAEGIFVRAMKVEPENHVPYYYVGLINYATGDYRTAEVLFKTALDLGAEPALTNYALGVNAFAGNRYDASARFLMEARTADEAGFAVKVDSLLSRIETLR